VAEKPWPNPVDCPDCRRLTLDPQAKSTYQQWRRHCAWHDEKAGRPIVTGSAFKDDPDPRIKREPEQPEPEPLTREEMEQLNQARVDVLRAQGRLPSFDQVNRDVIDWLERMGLPMPEEQ
jgi:hypothetical protein